MGIDNLDIKNEFPVTVNRIFFRSRQGVPAPQARS